MVSKFVLDLHIHYEFVYCSDDRWWHRYWSSHIVRIDRYAIGIEEEDNGTATLNGYIISHSPILLRQTQNCGKRRVESAAFIIKNVMFSVVLWHQNRYPRAYTWYLLSWFSHSKLTYWDSIYLSNVSRWDNYSLLSKHFQDSFLSKACGAYKSHTNRTAAYFSRYIATASLNW